MSIQNTLALINMYRSRNVTAARTPMGIVFFGMRNLKPAERKTLTSISQADLEAAIRWQK